MLDGVLRRSDLQHLPIKPDGCLYRAVNAKERLRDFRAPRSD